MKINVTKALLADIPAIAEIAAQSFPDPWTEKGFSDELTREGALLLAAKDESENILGYITGDMDESFGYIASVAVAIPARGQGVGTLLLKEFEKMLPLSAQKITLEVRESNSPAISLYEKNGYKQIGVRKNFYGEINVNVNGKIIPRENAIVMERIIK
ncbi:MAG: ribosomal protein S18-alanine N-acetyltransferase [Oscillospiraceae bacterium]|nr:ribosomal protein S18-alanine N-acetyltransferase [Oscillospiraceae bacterium]